MTDLRTAAQQALEALETCTGVPHWPALMPAVSALRAALAPAYTEGHCKEKAKPGGCQLHNLHCGYPACDRKPTVDEIDQPTTEAEQIAMRRGHALRRR